nr:hypothetical protein [Tanacetum cinerariifolium]
KITVVILVRERCPHGKVPGLMTHLVTSLTPDSANSYVMQGASCTQRKVSMVLFVLTSVLLLVVIIVTVVIVIVISIVVFVAIVRVVVFVVGSGVSSINKLSLVIIGSFSCYWSSTCPGVAACASRAVAMLLATIYQMAARVINGATNVDVLLGGIYSRQHRMRIHKMIYSYHKNNGMSDPIGGLDIKSNEDTSDEDRGTGLGDSTRVSVSLGKKTSMSKRYLVKSFEDSEEMLPSEAEK